MTANCIALQANSARHMALTAARRHGTRFKSGENNGDRSWLTLRVRAGLNPVRSHSRRGIRFRDIGAQVHKEWLHSDQIQLGALRVAAPPG
jgi:hypothetical protein